MTHPKYLKFFAMAFLLSTSVGASSSPGEHDNTSQPGSVPAATPSAYDELSRFGDAVRALRLDEGRIQEVLASASTSTPMAQGASASTSQVPALPGCAQEAGFSSWEALLARPEEARRLARASFARGSEGFEDAIFFWVMLIRRGGEERQADLYEYATVLFQQGISFERSLFWVNAMAMAEELVGRDLRAQFNLPQKEGATTQHRQHDDILRQSRALICRFLDGGLSPSQEVRDTCVRILSYNRCKRLGLSDDAQTELGATRRAIALFGEAPCAPQSVSDGDLLTLTRLCLHSHGLDPEDAISAQNGARLLKAYLARKVLPGEGDFYSFFHVLERVIGHEGVPSDLYVQDAAKFMERVMKKIVTLNDKSVPSWYFNKLLPLLETRLPAQKLMKRYALVGELTGSSMNPYAPVHMEGIPQSVLYHCESIKDRLPAQAFAKAAALAQTLEDRNYHLLRKAQFLQNIADMRVLISAVPGVLHMDLTGTQNDFMASAAASWDIGAYTQEPILRATLLERAALDLSHAFRVGYDPLKPEDILMCAQILAENAHMKAEAACNQGGEGHQEYLAHAAVPALEQFLKFCEIKKHMIPISLSHTTAGYGAELYSLLGQSAHSTLVQKKPYFQRAVSLWERAFEGQDKTSQAYLDAARAHHWLGAHLSGQEGNEHLRKAVEVWMSRPVKELPDDEESALMVARIWSDARNAARGDGEKLGFLEGYLDTLGYLFYVLPGAELSQDQMYDLAKHAHEAWAMTQSADARLRLVVRVAPALPLLVVQTKVMSEFRDTFVGMTTLAQERPMAVAQHQMNRPFVPTHVQMK